MPDESKKMIQIKNEGERVSVGEEVFRYEATNEEKDKIKCLDSKVAELRSIINKLEIDKKNLIVQLVDMEHLKDQNQQLKKRLNIKTV